MPFDDLLRPGHSIGIVRVDVDGAVVLDIDLATGLGDDALDRLPPGPISSPIFSGLIRSVSIRGA